jgi:hypothetical protein
LQNPLNLTKLSLPLNMNNSLFQLFVARTATTRY